MGEGLGGGESSRIRRREGEPRCDLVDVLGTMHEAQEGTRKRGIRDLGYLHGHRHKQGLAGTVVIVDRDAAALPTMHIYGVTEQIPHHDIPRYLAVVIRPPLLFPDFEAAVYIWPTYQRISCCTAELVWWY